ncbi:MAG TPA: hypothetical protein VK004_04320 [Ignavibacteria bacterium]|nr:hypothetical protein [Ignavibacteria bacterium]
MNIKPFILKIIWWTLFAMMILYAIQQVAIMKGETIFIVSFIATAWIIWIILIPLMYITICFHDKKIPSLSLIIVGVIAGAIIPGITQMLFSWYAFVLNPLVFIFCLIFSGILMVFKKELKVQKIERNY